jgi:enoyl-CoA hydratase
MPDYKYLDLRREGATLVCTINNPPKNFLNQAILRELTTMGNEIASDESIRALVITGGVEGIFITHYDVGELIVAARIARENPDFGGGPDLHDLHKFLLKLQDPPIVTIAAVNGTAMGGGCELALGCDFRIKSTEGPFGLPEVRVGLLPGGGGTQRFARLLGTAKALELMLLGKTVDGETAERLGLVHRAVAPDRVLPEALALAEELGKRPRESIGLIKQCVYKGSEMPLIEALHFEQDAFWKTMRTDDAARLMPAYLESGLPLDQQ